MVSIAASPLAGCCNKKETKISNANINGSDITTSYVYKGDKILKQISEDKISYMSVDASNKEGVAEILDALNVKYQNTPGIKGKPAYSDTYTQENVAIDMEKVDIEALQATSGTELSKNISKSISIKQMQTIMEPAGFKKVR